MSEDEFRVALLDRLDAIAALLQDIAARADDNMRHIVGAVNVGLQEVQNQVAASARGR